jgi:hypothetical protein
MLVGPPFREADMPRFTIAVLALLMLTAVSCGHDGAGDEPAQHDGSESAEASSPPAASNTGQPRPGWQIHVNQFARFAIWHPPGWTVAERRGEGRSLELTLTPPRQGDNHDDNAVPGGVVVRRQFGAPEMLTDVPNTQCRQIRISQLPGVRCLDTISGRVIAVLAGTGQGTFTFETSRRSAGYPEFDHIVAGFQLLRGA